MARITNIPETDNVLRYAKNKHLLWELDDKGDPIEIKACLHDLFKLRNDVDFIKTYGAPETSLSVNWIEFFTGDDAQKLDQTIQDFLGASRKLKKREAFAKLNVGALKEVCKIHAAKIRVIHDAKKNSQIKSHSSITQLPQNNNLLFDDLCELALSTLVPAKNFL